MTADTTQLFRLMMALATVSSLVIAWRKRDLKHALIAAFLAYSCVIDLVRLQLAGATPGGAVWHVDVLLHLSQCATTPALALWVLLQRKPWPALIGWACAAALVLVYPRSVVWLYLAADLAEAVGCGVCVLLWMRNARRMSLPEGITVLFSASVIVSAIGHDTLRQIDSIWQIRSAVVSAVLLMVIFLQLRGAWIDETA